MKIKAIHHGMDNKAERCISKDDVVIVGFVAFKDERTQADEIQAIFTRDYGDGYGFLMSDSIGGFELIGDGQETKEDRQNTMEMVDRFFKKDAIRKHTIEVLDSDADVAVKLKWLADALRCSAI